MYKFKKHDSVGAADAESDLAFLENCFIDTGDLDALKNCEDPKRIIVGRTGSGKSALLLRLKHDCERVIEIHPESLSLSHIANSTVLNFFIKAGVDLDLFFKFLWRHVFTVELIKKRYNIQSEKDKTGLMATIQGLFRGKRHANALDYLNQWGGTFWEETEYRIKEITTKLEQELTASVGGIIPGAQFDLDAAKKLTEEQKRDVIQRGQHVVNQVQVRQLSDIFDLLTDILDDHQKHYYIVIDQLDEKWVVDPFKYRLIRALIETIRDFGRIRQAKIVICLRLDLLGRVFKLTRDAGFQEEKYEPLYLKLNWTREQLIRILDARVNFLIQSQYTTAAVFCKDILPRQIRKYSAIDYIIDRSLMRPRDVILFFNDCLQAAAGSTSITAQMVLKAEGEYSRGRLRSLCDEWYSDYPNLFSFSVSFLRKRPPQFPINTITKDECGDMVLDLATKGFESEDILSKTASAFLDGRMGYLDFLRDLFSHFYHAGLIGLRLKTADPILSATSYGHRNISTAEISDSAKVVINKMFWRVLGVHQDE